MVFFLIVKKRSLVVGKFWPTTVVVTPALSLALTYSISTTLQLLIHCVCVWPDTHSKHPITRHYLSNYWWLLKLMSAEQVAVNCPWSKVANFDPFHPCLTNSTTLVPGLFSWFRSFFILDLDFEWRTASLFCWVTLHLTRAPFWPSWSFTSMFLFRKNSFPICCFDWQLDWLIVLERLSFYDNCRKVQFMIESWISILFLNSFFIKN